jgi:phospholipase D1/2
MVVDDRLAIIGSANINERSQRGDRDSELAVVIRDTDMIDSTMAGKPFKVGRFAHTMRVRLMREHLGVDVDDIEAQEAANVNRPPASRDGSQDEEDDQWDPDHEQRRDGDPDAGQTRVQARTTAATQFGRTVGQAVSGMANNLSNEIRNEASENNPLARGAAKALDSDDQPKGGDEEGATGSTQDYVQDGDERAKRIAENPENPGSASNRPVVPTLEERFVAEQRQNGGSSTPRNNNRSRGGSVSETAAQRRAANGSSHDLKHKQSRGGAGGNPWALPAETPEVDKDNFTDPVCDEFFRDVWLASAVHNTDIFRRVFKATPDDNVLTWSEFKAWTAWYDRLQRSFRSETTKPPPEQQGPPPGEDGASLSTSQSRAADEKGTGKSSSAKVQEAPSTLPRATPKMPNEGFSPQELDQMEALLGELQGTLVMHSTRFLEAEGECRCAADLRSQSLTSSQISRTTCSSRSTASARCRCTTERDVTTTRASPYPASSPRTHLRYLHAPSTHTP